MTFTLFVYAWGCFSDQFWLVKSVEIKQSGSKQDGEEKFEEQNVTNAGKQTTG